jgi:hypothetical protein
VIPKNRIVLGNRCLMRSRHRWHEATHHHR